MKGRRNKRTNLRPVIDTYAWVEYLLGSKLGAAAREHVESEGVITSAVTVLELEKWYLREIEEHRRTEGEMQQGLAFVESASEVVTMDAPLARKAGELDFLMKKRIKGWPMADSIVYATARTHSGRVVTGDPHFRGLDDVLFLGSP